mmetsp:Transcript_96569/g.251737  ORF Transcript_96569/g.251737 Transcript_96569/m.251737 type:complete len:254 (+) Transcript_96569:1187-1948(+)
MKAGDISINARRKSGFAQQYGVCTTTKGDRPFLKYRSCTSAQYFANDSLSRLQMFFHFQPSSSATETNGDGTTTRSALSMQDCSKLSGQRAGESSHLPSMIFSRAYSSNSPCHLPSIDSLVLLFLYLQYSWGALPLATNSPSPAQIGCPYKDCMEKFVRSLSPNLSNFAPSSGSIDERFSKKSLCTYTTGRLLENLVAAWLLLRLCTCARSRACARLRVRARPATPRACAPGAARRAAAARARAAPVQPLNMK